MTDTDWLQVLSRLSPSPAEMIDTQVFGAPPRVVPTPQMRGEDGTAGGSSRLWAEPESDYTRIGIRVADPLAHPVQLAARLAAAAIERKVAPVILTTLAVSGFERFGFRVERLPADSAERDRCEAELSAFWNFALVLDAAEGAVLG